MPRLSTIWLFIAVIGCDGHPAAPLSGGAWASGVLDGGGAGGAVDSSSMNAKLDQLLDQLRANRDGTLRVQSQAEGWPAQVDAGWLFVSDDLALDRLAGDFNGWIPQPMNREGEFAWLVATVNIGARYKFTNGNDWRADPWSRAYTYDDNGAMSLVHPNAGGHIERFFAVKDAAVDPRTVRVWLPTKEATRVLYVHDGQNLFDPEGPWGGWRLQQSVPDDTMLVGIDNTGARIDEYTQVQDDIGDGLRGGKGDAYAEFVDVSVRALIAKEYGEPTIVGTMGSSLGGLISLHIADHFPGQYRFAASLSGTLGWGSIGSRVHNDTIIDRYAKHGHQKTVLYVDSGGDGSTCVDSDHDGIDDDDPSGSDNFCETKQMKTVLGNLGYQAGDDLFYWHELGAKHNEAAWASRVFRPMQIFAELK